MAGTSVSVLTPYTAERVEPVVVAAMAGEGLHRTAADPRYWHSASRFPYGYSIDQPEYETDPAEIELVERAVGRALRCDIGLHIFVSDPAGRPLLGRLAQRVAERTEGWVFVEFQARPPAGLLEHLEGSGRCIRVEGSVYVDAWAMTAWYAHPAFHVVK